MSGFGSAYLGVLAAGAFLLCMFPLELALVLGLGRVPVWRPLVQLASDYERLIPRRLVSLVACAAALLAAQFFPLSNLGLLGEPQGAGSVAWAGAILAELVFGVLAWRGTGRAGQSP
jgi:hypothetical protein